MKSKIRVLATILIVMSIFISQNVFSQSGVCQENRNVTWKLTKTEFDYYYLDIKNQSNKALYIDWRADRTENVEKDGGRNLVKAGGFWRVTIYAEDKNEYFKLSGIRVYAEDCSN